MKYFMGLFYASTGMGLYKKYVDWEAECYFSKTTYISISSYRGHPHIRIHVQHYYVSVVTKFTVSILEHICGNTT